MSDSILASTYLSPTINTIQDLVLRSKSMLGFPIQSDELTDYQWLEIIKEGLEVFTQFGGGVEEEYLVFTSDDYSRGCGVKLDDLVNYNYGCNVQHCNETTVVETITSTIVECENLLTTTGYLSVTPFVYPTPFDVNDPLSTPFSGTSGQYFYLYYDKKNLWNATDICDATCISINPVSSQWFQLSANHCLSAYSFDFVNDSTISALASTISSYTNYPLSAVPLNSLGSALSTIPINFYDIDCFYPVDAVVGPPMEACVDIGKGMGYIYPKCNTALINSCSALSSQYNISPTWSHVLTSITLSSVTVNTSANNFATISSYFTQFCNECNCNCALLSTYNSEASSYHFETYKNVISGADGQVFDLSATDISSATHVRLNDIPSCTQNGSIPLLSNDGIVASFVLCNSAISTNGPMYMEDVQFFKDYTLPEEILSDSCASCGWINNGFTMSYYNSAYGDCVRSTPERIKVNVSFNKKNYLTEYGTVSTTVSSNYDEGLQRRRKIHGVFTLDDVSGNGGFFGGSSGDVLFNFDYALMGSVFGYDLPTYHMAKSFVEHSRKMLRYVSYSFNPKTQMLKVHPEPIPTSSDNCGCVASGMGNSGAGRQAYLLGVKVEAPIEQMLSEYFIKEYVLAKAMQVIGIVRSKFGNVTIYSGQTITGDLLFQHGTQRIEKLMTELRDESRFSDVPAFFIG
jgi:hypothetical protein